MDHRPGGPPPPPRGKRIAPAHHDDHRLEVFTRNYHVVAVYEESQTGVGSLSISPQIPGRL